MHGLMILSGPFEMLCVKLEGCYRAAATLTDVRIQRDDCFLDMQGSSIVAGDVWHPCTPASSHLGFWIQCRTTLLSRLVLQ